MKLDSDTHFDYVIVGGGLQGNLLLSALAEIRPDARILLIEKQSQIGGNHTWSFHRTDISNQVWQWFAKLVDKSWPRYNIRLGGFSRTIEIPYGSIFSHKLAIRIEELTQGRNHFRLLNGVVSSLNSKSVALESGQTFTANAILDCRGVDSSNLPQSGLGYQKFFGLEVEIDEPWQQDCPCLMDDEIDQSDGFRFMYTLPFSRHQLLVEDTRFSNTPELDQQDCNDRILNYLRACGYHDVRIVRAEHGCLPMPYRKLSPLSNDAIGYRGQFFHPATGYSIPLVANLADRIARSPIERVTETIVNFRQQNNFQRQFSLWLNRMLFKLVKPASRADIFRRFYRRMPISTIQRFYAHRFTAADAVRLVVGRPPSGLTPIRFFNSFREQSCPQTPI